MKNWYKTSEYLFVCTSAECEESSTTLGPLPGCIVFAAGAIKMK